MAPQLSCPISSSIWASISVLSLPIKSPPSFTMSNRARNFSGSSRKQQDFTEVVSDAEDKISSNLTGAASTRQLNADSTCGHVSPEPTPAHESVNGLNRYEPVPLEP